MKDPLDITLSEVRAERVKHLNPNHGYKIPEVMYVTGWSRSFIYLVMSDGRLKYHQQGSHRRIKGMDIKHLFNNQ